MDSQEKNIEMVDLNGVNCLSIEDQMRIRCDLDCYGSWSHFTSRCKCDNYYVVEGDPDLPLQLSLETNNLGDLISKKSVLNANTQKFPGINTIQDCIRDRSGGIKEIICTFHIDKNSLQDHFTDCYQFITKLEDSNDGTIHHLFETRKPMKPLDFSRLRNSNTNYGKMECPLGSYPISIENALWGNPQEHKKDMCMISVSLLLWCLAFCILWFILYKLLCKCKKYCINVMTRKANEYVRFHE